MLNRREFLQKSLTGAIGAGIVWQFGGSLSWAQIRWEEEKEGLWLADVPDATLSPMHQFETENVPATRQDWPVIAIDSAGNPWMAFVHQGDSGEQIHLRSFDGKNFTEDIQLSESAGHAARPMIIAHRDGVAVVWAEKHGADWHVFLREVMNGTPGDIQKISAAGGINWRPAIASWKDGMIVAWERKAENGRFEILARQVEPKGLSPVMTVSKASDRDCHRPAVATDSDGRSWIAWDQFDGPGGPNIYLTNFSMDQPVQVTHHPAANLSPAIAVDEDDRVWIAWHSNRRDNDKWDIPRWFYLRAYKDGKLYDPVSEPKDKNLDKEGTDQSFEFVRLYTAADGRVIVTGRPSHAFCIQHYHGGDWSRMYRLPSTGDWGGRGQFLDAAFDKAGDMWVVRRDWGANVLQKISGLSQEHAKPELKESTEAKDAAPKLVNIHTAPRRWEPLKELEGIDTPLNIYYGDIHGHTRMSDGVGDVDEYFYTRRDYYEDDFAALTDHDNFVRLPIFPSGWEYQKALMKHFNNPGRFVTVFSQESTTARYPRAYGHKNIYGLNEDMKLLDHTMPEYNTSQKMNKAVKEMNALIFPHHTGWIGTDWENADEEIQTLAEICSNHGVFEFPGNKPITHRGNVKGCFIQDGLARGLKFGLIGGSDSHGLIWHHHAGWKRDCNRTGLAAVLAPELTPEAILDAMRKRRTFATTGIKVRVDFRVNNHLMGSEFESADGKLEISADLAGREDIKWATVVKDNEDLYIYGGDGYTTRFTIDDEIPADGKWHYYYLRVEYEGPEMAWSSPIWVKRSA